MGKPNKKTIAQVLLGLIVVWQLVFMAASTADVLITGGPLPQDEEDAVRAPLDTERIVFGLPRWWSKLTLQRQYWRLFASFSPRSIFPAVKLVWHGGHDGEDRVVVLPSRFEPENTDQPLSLDYTPIRFYHFEANLALLYIHWDDETVADEPDEYRDFREYRTRIRWQPLIAYLRLRLDEYQQQNPGESAPDEVILQYHVYDSPGPYDEPEYFGPLQRPLARWQPARDVPEGYLPVEAYDPKTQSFFAVKARP